MTVARKSHCVKAAADRGAESAIEPDFTRSCARQGARWTLPASPRAALPATRARTHEPLDDWNQNSDACGGARAPSDAVGGASSPRSRRCASIRSLSSGSSMLAITFNRPPQRTHCAISIPNTRFRRRAQFIRTSSGAGRSGGAARFCAPAPLPAMALERGATRQVHDVPGLVEAVALYFDQPDLRRAAGRSRAHARDGQPGRARADPGTRRGSAPLRRLGGRQVDKGRARDSRSSPERLERQPIMERAGRHQRR